MRLASAYSLRRDTAEASEEAVSALLSRLGAAPELILVYATEHHAQAALIAAITARAPDAEIIGGTSCGGVMTEAGFHAGPDGALGMLGISDPQGSYGAGGAVLGDDPFGAGARAVEQALAAAGRDYETPVLVWCCQPPGHEEAVIAGVQSIIGPGTPIIGGSSADDAVAGHWRQFCTAGVLEGHAVVAVLFPSVPHGAAFQSGYAPTEHEGLVTRTADHAILQIDHRPAAEVYCAWTEGAVAITETGPILAQSTPTPLGRVAGEEHGVPLYLLSHPAMIGEDGGLSLFTEIEVGDRVCMMRGSEESLIRRAGLVVRDACAAGGWRAEDTCGGLLIYCAGCMLHVRERMDEVAGQVAEAFGDAPFLGAFTFGEQGAIVGSGARHGNLMVAALAFG